MYHDDFEHDIAASMDDLDNIDTITIPPPASTPITTAKLAKFKRLPEIDKNSTITTDVPSSSADLLFRVSSDALAACIGSGDLRKTVLINNSANEILSNSLINTSGESLNNDDTSIQSPTNDDDIELIALPDEKIDDNTVVPATGTRRKFIVTRMNSNVLLDTPTRPEAENLKNLTPKSNYATISFPCSSSMNRSPLGNLFGTNTTFEPHLDKRFFDTSLVRINSTQSSTVSAASSQDNSINADHDVWERRKDFAATKQLAVKFEPSEKSVRVLRTICCLIVPPYFCVRK